jgi:hypothetical protein
MINMSKEERLNDIPVTTWAQKVYPSSGPGVSLSGSGVESWSPWIPIVAPTKNFEVVKVHVVLKQPDKHYIEYGRSGQSDTDISYIEVAESGTTMIDTLNPAHRYKANTPISARKKTEQGSGVEVVLKILTREGK